VNSTVKVYTSEEIAACLDGFKGFPGFTGVSCTKCGGTANIPAFGAGWFCDCGYFNHQLWRDLKAPHVVPSMGPSLATINLGKRMSRRFRRLVDSAHLVKSFVPSLISSSTETPALSTITLEKGGDVDNASR
jgi:hypothetical protein